MVRDAVIALGFVWGHPSNRGKRVRVAARAIGFQVRGRVFGKPTRVPCGERSSLELLPSFGASGLVYANPLEAPEIAVWRATLRPGDLFIDVGAHVGSYTVWAAELGARVIAVEPDPGAAAALRRNVEINGFDVEILEAAVSDRAGEAGFTVGGGVLNHLVTEGDAGRVVRTLTLDALIGDRVVAGLKIDVEGAEGLALRGAERALRERRIRLLQLEWNPQASVNFGTERSEIAELLEGSGYELCRPDRAGRLIPIEHHAPGPDVFARLTRGNGEVA